MQALFKLIPQLAAEDSLRRTAEIALGGGNLKKEDARDLRDHWLEQAEAAPPRRVQSVDDLKRATAALGIRFELVPHA